MPSMRPAVGDAVGVTVHYAAATETIGKPCRTGYPQCDIAGCWSNLRLFGSCERQVALPGIWVLRELAGPNYLLAQIPGSLTCLRLET